MEKDKRNIRKKFGIDVNTTANKCLYCGSPLLNRARGQIQYFCCKLHRKLSRSGKRNRRILKRMVRKS